MVKSDRALCSALSCVVVATAEIMCGGVARRILGIDAKLTLWMVGNF